MNRDQDLEKEIVDRFVYSILEVSRRKCSSNPAIYTLVEVMAEARADLAINRDILELSDRIKKPGIEKDFKEYISLHKTSSSSSPP